jgi:hypothetical protein
VIIEAKREEGFFYACNGIRISLNYVLLNHYSSFNRCICSTIVFLSSSLDHHKMSAQFICKSQCTDEDHLLPKYALLNHVKT